MFAAKSKVLIPLILMVCALPLALQYQAIFALERETTLLRARLAAHDTAPGADPKQAKSAAMSPGDWKRISKELDSMWDHGRSDSRILLRFDQRLLTMTREELVAGLEELNTLGLLGTYLEDRLIIQLGQQAPELALTWSIDHIAQAGGRITDDEITPFDILFEDLLKQDLQKGIRWFDQMIAAGKFHSTSLRYKYLPRTRMEITLLRKLLATDVAAAGRRLSALPENQRASVLAQLK